MKTRIREYWRSTDGHFAVYTALLGMPLLLGVGIALDSSAVDQETTALQNALDSAALAAVIPATLTIDEREAYAKEVFFKNYTSNIEVSFIPDATRNRVHLEGQAQLPSKFGKMVGRSHIKLVKQSEAVLTTEAVVCVLALDPKGERSIEFKDNATFTSPACSVQANSTHKEALFSSLPQEVTARSFCVTGGSRGRFGLVLKNDCSPIDDPYEHRVLPQVDAKSGGCSKIDTVKSATVLHPGAYCNGLKIDGASVTFLPGVYHITGELLFTSTSRIEGDGVTFILKGKDGKLKLDNDAKVRLKAPSQGTSAGLVFWQTPYTSGSLAQGRKKSPYKNATEKSEISASADIKIIGTAYFPTQELTITSDRAVKSRSPATSFIAYRLQFAGNSYTEVRVDHEAGGIPPILPRSDEGARLVH